MSLLLLHLFAFVVIEQISSVHSYPSIIRYSSRNDTTTAHHYPHRRVWRMDRMNNNRRHSSATLFENAIKLENLFDRLQHLRTNEEVLLSEVRRKSRQQRSFEMSVLEHRKYSHS